MLNLNFPSFPNLTTSRLTLRQLKADDANEIFLIRSDASVNQYLDRPKANSIEDARIFIEKIRVGMLKKDSLYWAITLKNDSKLIGTVTLWNISVEEMKGEIGYELLPAFQGKGIMQEAIAEVLAFGFEKIGLKKIEAFTHARNEKSVRLLMRNNFSRDAELENELKQTDEFGEMVTYSLVETNWRRS